MAAMYAVYHGPKGLKAIAERAHGLAGAFAVGLKKLGTAEVQDLPFFDTVKVKVADANAIADAAHKSSINLRVVDKNTVIEIHSIFCNRFLNENISFRVINNQWIAFQITVAFDETTTLKDVDDLFSVFSGGKPVSV